MVLNKNTEGYNVPIIEVNGRQIGRAHVRTPVTRGSRMPSSA